MDPEVAAADGRQARQARWWIGIAGLCIALVMVLVPGLGGRSLWTDEAFTIEATSSWARLHEVLTRYETNMVLYYAVMAAWTRLGDAEWWVRLPSVLAALATIPVLFCLVRRLTDARTAFCACVLLCIHPKFLGQAEDARSYALLILSSTLATLLFVRALEGDQWRRWCAYVPVIAAAVYCHYFGILVFAAHAIALVAMHPDPRRWLRALVAAGAVGLAMVPLVVWRPQQTDQVDWIPPLSVHDVGQTLAALLGGRSGLALVAIEVLLIGLGAWTLWRSPPGPAWPGRRTLVLLATWALVPIGAALACSLLLRPVFITRYFVPCLPALAALAAVGASRLGPRWCWFVLGAALVPTAYERWQDRYAFCIQQDWREIVTTIAAKAGPRDAVICYAYFGALSVRHYQRHLEPPRPELAPLEYALAPYHPGGGARDPAPDLVRLEDIAHTHERVWLILCDEQAERLGRPENVARIRSTLAGALPRMQRFEEFDLEVYDRGDAPVTSAASAVNGSVEFGLEKVPAVRTNGAEQPRYVPR